MLDDVCGTVKDISQSYYCKGLRVKGSKRGDFRWEFRVLSSKKWSEEKFMRAGARGQGEDFEELVILHLRVSYWPRRASSQAGCKGQIKAILYLNLGFFMETDQSIIELSSIILSYTPFLLTPSTSITSLSFTFSTTIFSVTLYFSVSLLSFSPIRLSITFSLIFFLNASSASFFGSFC